MRARQMIELLFFFALIIKHAFADLFLQTFIKKPHSKIRYFDNGHRHYAHHAGVNFVVCLFFVSPAWAVIYSLFDYIIHWHVDWGKTVFYTKFNWKRDEARFWRLQALDQALHYTTAFLIVLHAHTFAL